MIIRRRRFFILSLIPSGEWDPIGCLLFIWQCHSLVLSQRRNPLSKCPLSKGSSGVDGWNQMESIQTRRFCYSSSWGKKRREFFVPSHFPTFSESFCLEAGKRFQFLQLFNQLLSLFLFRIFSGLQQIVSVEYASERRRHKGKSVSHIRTQYRDKNRVDFCKSNRSRVGQRSRYWNLANRRGRRNNKQPSHPTIQTRRKSRNFNNIKTMLPLCLSFVEVLDNWPKMEWRNEIFGVSFCRQRMDRGIISLPRC